jgi:hypothetical protein
MPAATASSIALSRSNAPTSSTLARAPVAATASAHVAKTGAPFTSAVFALGDTPPTIRVPYCFIRPLCICPARPVIPCTMTGVFLSTLGLMLIRGGSFLVARAAM